MDNYAAVRAGDGVATLELLVLLAQRAGRRRYPPPHGIPSWNREAGLELVQDAFARKGPGFLAAALAETTDAPSLERYLDRVFTNVLRDQARATERGKLIQRMKTLFAPEADFVRHTAPFDAWRLMSEPEVVWQGDIADLIDATRSLRGLAVTQWNTSGPTPKATRVAIISVSRAVLGEAAAMVRDPDLAFVIQTCIPAVPIDPTVAETPVAEFALDGHQIDDYPDNQGPGPSETAGALWADLTEDERKLVAHLGDSERDLAAFLDLGRRAAAAVAESLKEKVRRATSPGEEEEMVSRLLEWATAEATGEAETDSEGVA